ncbi:MAG: hypothetical protein IT370_34380 [Deltaproteobacteria bacterium]|nr:hypothetical protein [Deltaproteobacteria bacterium]
MAKPRRPVRPKTPQLRLCMEPLEVIDHPAVFFQVPASVPVQAIASVTLMLFESRAAERKGVRPWLAFLGTDVLHHKGLSTWLGVSDHIPLTVLDSFEFVLRELGATTIERELGRPRHHGMEPLARLSADGLERLIDGKPTRDDAADLLDGVTESGTLRPYVWGAPGRRRG